MIPFTPHNNPLNVGLSLHLGKMRLREIFKYLTPSHSLVTCRVRNETPNSSNSFLYNLRLL